ncbi:MAG: hypothetical protein V3V23_05105, partial [Dehalococcoidales bacterium]
DYLFAFTLFIPPRFQRTLINLRDRVKSHSRKPSSLQLLLGRRTGEQVADMGYQGLRVST